MPKMKQTTDNTNDNMLIARALHESGRRHCDEFDGDPTIGEAMLGVLRSKFPEAERALAYSDNLRKALESGFLVPAGGPTPESVRAFLDQRKAAKDAIRTSPRVRSSYDLDPDIPF